MEVRRLVRKPRVSSTQPATSQEGLPQIMLLAIPPHTCHARTFSLASVQMSKISHKEFSPQQK